MSWIFVAFISHGVFQCSCWSVWESSRCSTSQVYWYIQIRWNEAVSIPRRCRWDWWDGSLWLTWFLCFGGHQPFQSQGWIPLVGEILGLKFQTLEDSGGTNDGFFQCSFLEVIPKTHRFLWDERYVYQLICHENQPLNYIFAVNGGFHKPLQLKIKWNTTCLDGECLQILPWDSAPLIKPPGTVGIWDLFSFQANSRKSTRRPFLQEVWMKAFTPYKNQSPSEEWFHGT